MWVLLYELIIMSKSGISERVKHFIFEYIDSVEQLDVLLFIRLNQDKTWSSDHIAHEIRSSSKSVSTRLQLLEQMGFLDKSPENQQLVKFRVGSAETEATLDDLAEVYKLKKQKVLELIFSPLKKGRHFANAFIVSGTRREEEGEDG